MKSELTRTDLLNFLLDSLYARECSYNKMEVSSDGRESYRRENAQKYNLMTRERLQTAIDQNFG